MEQRSNVRLPVSIHVILYHKGLQVINCKTRDISRKGMFIETGPVIYPRNAQVEVEFRVQEDGVNNRYRLPGKVVRFSRTGLGVMFNDLRSEDFQISHEQLGLLCSKAQSQSLYTFNP